MSSYRFNIGGQSPLQVQLGVSTRADSVARIREVAVYGESTTGFASDPVLVRPSAPGLGTENFVDPLSPGGAQSSFPIIYAFTTAPTKPIPTGQALFLPVTRRFVFPRGSEFIVYGNAAALLYATSSGGHLWGGELAWEEH